MLVPEVKVAGEPVRWDRIGHAGIETWKEQVPDAHQVPIAAWVSQLAEQQPFRLARVKHPITDIGGVQEVRTHEGHVVGRFVKAGRPRLLHRIDGLGERTRLGELVLQHGHLVRQQRAARDVAEYRGLVRAHEVLEVEVRADVVRVAGRLDLVVRDLARENIADLVAVLRDVCLVPDRLLRDVGSHIHVAGAADVRHDHERQCAQADDGGGSRGQR